MRALDAFVVEIPKKINDSITMNNGMEIFVDTRFEMGEFNYRVTEGTVTGVPARKSLECPVKVGDTIYFHHLVVINDGQVVPGETDKYFVYYDKERATKNQAFAFKCQDTGEIHPLDQWALLEPLETEEEESESTLELVRLKGIPVTKGVVSFRVDALDLDKGSVVGFKKNRDYRIKIDGKEYYRVATEQLLYQEV